MTSVELVVDQGREVAEEALTWPQRAKALLVRDAIAYLNAADMLKAIKALRQRIAETFDPHIKRAHEAHKALVKEKGDAEAPLTEAEGVLKRALLAYDEEQARQEEEARRLDEAAALELEGNRTDDVELLYLANELIEQPPQPVAPVTVAKTTPSVSGIVNRVTWSGRVTDKMRLLRFVVEHPEYANLVEPNAAAINQLARSLKGAMKVDGVQAFPTKSVAAGAGRS